jgi:hypothetical protein
MLKEADRAIRSAFVRKAFYRWQIIPFLGAVAFAIGALVVAAANNCNPQRAFRLATVIEPPSR